MIENEGSAEIIVDSEVTELSLLKERADTMGVKYHPNIGVATLKEKISLVQGAEILETPGDDKAYSETETPGQRLVRKKREATKLHRVRVTNMNPQTATHLGAIYSVGNSQIGFIKKYIPYGAESGWHVPSIILTFLQNKVFTVFYEVKVDNKVIKRSKTVPEYSIEMMAPLTSAELEELAQRQRVAE